MFTNSLKHWYYPYSNINGSVVRTACGRFVDSKLDIDFQAPTCPVCAEAMKNHENLDVDDSNTISRVFTSDADGEDNN